MHQSLEPISQFSLYRREGYTHLPLIKTLMADLDTPVTTYLKLADCPYTFLFESVQGGEQWGRYSIIGLAAKKVIRVCDGKILIDAPHALQQVVEVADPLEWIQSFMAGFRVVKIPELPRFSGGLVGYFGYESVRFF